MDTQLLPLVPFGKYKGQPITDLLNGDPSYLEYLKKQEWFRKYPTVYNIVVNQTITTNNNNSKTPEHNKLQNLFLDNNNVEKLLRFIYKKFRHIKNIPYEFASCEFEGLFNWDIIISNLSYTKLQCKCNWDEKKEGECCECKNYEDNDVEEYQLPDIYIEAKPLMGDDYPCVLRKMKLQKELTINSLQKRKEDILDEVGYIKGKDRMLNYSFKHGQEIKKTFEFIENNSRIFIGKYILLLKEFNSSTTSKDELIEIFKQSNIDIIFTNDLFETPITKQVNLEEENKILRENLLHSEKKIKQLEEEIKLLKTQKQSKTIECYFKK